MAACVKHFAGYGGATAGRDYNTVELSEHTFREFYLRSYEAGVKAGAAMVMTSFNTVNGIPATGNRWLMRRILREEMGFDGVLISDWAAIEEMIPHGYCADRKEAAIRAIRAGVDIDMMTGHLQRAAGKAGKGRHDSGVSRGRGLPADPDPEKQAGASLKIPSKMRMKRKKRPCPL